MGAVAAVDPHLPHGDAVSFAWAVDDPGDIVAILVPGGLIGGIIRCPGGVLQQQILVLLTVLVKLRQVVEIHGPGGVPIFICSNDGLVTQGDTVGPMAPLRHDLTVPGEGQVGGGVSRQRTSAGNLVQVEGQVSVLRWEFLAFLPNLDHLVVQLLRHGVDDGGLIGASLFLIDLHAVGHFPAILRQGEGRSILVQEIFAAVPLIHAGLHPAVLQKLSIIAVGVNALRVGPERQLLLGKAGLSHNDAGVLPVCLFTRRFLSLRAQRPGLKGEFQRHILQLALEGGGVPDFPHHGGDGVRAMVGDGAAVVNIAVAVCPLGDALVQRVLHFAGLRVHRAENLLIGIIARLGVDVLPHHVDVAVALRVVFLQFGVDRAVRALDQEHDLLCVIFRGLCGFGIVGQDIGPPAAVRHRGGGGVGRPLPVAPQVELHPGPPAGVIIRPDLFGLVGGGAGEGHIGRATVVDLRGDGAHIGGAGVVIAHQEVVLPQLLRQLAALRRAELCPIFYRGIHIEVDGGAVQVVFPAAGDGHHADGGVILIR